MRGRWCWSGVRRWLVAACALTSALGWRAATASSVSSSAVSASASASSVSMPSAGPPSGAAEQAPVRLIVVVVVDQLRADLLDRYGGGRADCG